MANKPITLGWLRGMNNIAPDFDLPSNTLRDAVNVDVLDSGALRRRQGATLRLATPDAHSFWSNDAVAFFVSAGNLMQLQDDLTAKLLRANVGFGTMQYEEAGGEVFFTNNTVLGRIRGGVAYELGVEAPSVPPGLALTNGYLSAGTYQCLCTFVNAQGEESAASRAVALRLGVPGGLTLTVPPPTSPEVVAVRLYLTQPDGELFYAVADLALGTSTTGIISAPDYGPVCRTQFMARMFAAETLEYYRGRMYYAAGNILWFSEPFQYGLFNPSENFIVFDAPVTLVEAVEDGIYLACDQTYFLAGTEPKEFRQQQIFPFGAARFSSTKHARSPDTSWYSDRGIVIGSNGGTATLIQNDNVMPEAHLRGATLVKEYNSLNQIISAVSGSPAAASLAALDYMDAEITRARG